MRASAYADPDVTAVQVLGHYRLRLTFADGLQGDVDVSDLGELPGDLVAPLRDPEYFRQVRVDPEQGTVVWPNGVDLAAERLYDEASEHPVTAPAQSSQQERRSHLRYRWRSILVHHPESDPVVATVWPDFQSFAANVSEPLETTLAEILVLPRAESHDLIQLALTEAADRWQDPVVAGSPLEWVMGTAWTLAHNRRREVVPAVAHSLASADVRVTGAVALAAGVTPVPDSPPAAPFRDRDFSDADRVVMDLYSTYYGSLLRLAALLVRDLGTAEEVVQDAFVAMHGGWHGLRDNEKALAYLRQSVVNRSRSVLRDRLVVDQNTPKPPPDMPTAEHGAIAQFERSAVIAAMRSLPARQREALVLRFYADMSEAQIAEVMQISRGAVKSHTARAMRALRRALED